MFFSRPETKIAESEYSRQLLYDLTSHNYFIDIYGTNPRTVNQDNDDIEYKDKVVIINPAGEYHRIPDLQLLNCVIRISASDVMSEINHGVYKELIDSVKLEKRIKVDVLLRDFKMDKEDAKTLQDVVKNEKTQVWMFNYDPMSGEEHCQRIPSDEPLLRNMQDLTAPYKEIIKSALGFMPKKDANKFIKELYDERKAK